MTHHKVKQVPSFWWDMGEHNTIIVESDIDEFPIVAEFVFNPVPWDAISKAQMLIDELNSGRTSAKKELQQRPLQFDHK